MKYFKDSNDHYFRLDGETWTKRSVYPFKDGDEYVSRIRYYQTTSAEHHRLNLLMENGRLTEVNGNEAGVDQQPIESLL